MKSIVPVVFATDDNFVSCCAVAIASLIYNCDKNRSYKLYIFYDTLSEANQNKLLTMAQENVSIEFIHVISISTKNCIMFMVGKLLRPTSVFSQ